MQHNPHFPPSLKEHIEAGTPPVPAFDNLVAMAATTFGSHASLVSIEELDGRREFPRSRHFVPVRSSGLRPAPLLHSFCRQVVLIDAPLVVRDTALHPLVRDDRSIDSPGIAAYLGVPVHGAARIPLGVLSVIGRQPRDWSDRDLAIMERLATCVSDAIHLRAEIIASVEGRGEQQCFTYAIAHELKAPANTLHLLLGEISELQGQVQAGASGDLVAQCQKTVSRMRWIVDDVLTYIQLIGGQLHIEPVDLAAVTAEILADLKADIAQSGAVVTSDGLPVWTGNRLQLRILLQNLIGNAIKFRKPGTAPVVAVQGSASADGRQLRLTVSDNGIGIPPESQHKVFRLFHRLHARGEYAGTGLGLSLCQRVAANHGGEILVRSEPDMGSEFTVLLPREPA